MEENIKIRNNAISAYFMLFICISFLFAKNNRLLYNSFVKIHTKTAFLIHMLFLLVYIIFINFSLWSSIRILNFSLNHIIAPTLFIWLFWILLFWMYRAYRWKTLTIWEVLSYKWKNKMIINTNRVTSEKEKIPLILAYIPFLWYIVYWKNFTNKTIKDINKINLISSIIIFSLYIAWNNNLAILVILFYIIGLVFINTILIVNNENRTPDLDKIPSIWEIYILIKSYFKYLKIYFNNKNFKWIKDIHKEIETDQIKIENNIFKYLKNKNDTKLPKFLIYVPLINILFLFSLKSKFKIHIINSIIISIFTIISIILFKRISITLLVLFPIFYWTGYINRLWYKMPFIYDFYIMVEKISIYIKSIFSKIMKIKDTTEEVTMKVWENKNIQDTWKIVSKTINTEENLEKFKISEK
jgi:hypothetical protein